MFFFGCEKEFGGNGAAELFVRISGFFRNIDDYLSTIKNNGNFLWYCFVCVFGLNCSTSLHIMSVLMIAEAETLPAVFHHLLSNYIHISTLRPRLLGNRLIFRCFT